MNVTVQPNPWKVTAITAAPVGDSETLVSLNIVEGETNVNFDVCLRRDNWQQVVDQLAAVGILATGATRTVPSSAQTVRHASEVSA